MRVPVGRIEAAVRALAARVQTAHEALGPNATVQELAAAADALKAGVPRETLREMRRAGRDGSWAVPLGVLTQLVVRGVPVEKASVQVVRVSAAAARKKFSQDACYRPWLEGQRHRPLPAGEDWG